MSNIGRERQIDYIIADKIFDLVDAESSSILNLYLDHRSVRVAFNYFPHSHKNKKREYRMKWSPHIDNHAETPKYKEALDHQLILYASDNLEELEDIIMNAANSSNIVKDKISQKLWKTEKI